MRGAQFRSDPFCISDKGKSAFGAVDIHSFFPSGCNGSRGVGRIIYPILRVWPENT
jgi:predicted small secreted protein